MRTYQSLFLSAGLVLLIGPAVYAQAARKPAASPPTPSIVKQLMEAIESASDVVSKVGAEEPKTDEDWTRVAQNAVKLADAGKRLMTGDYAKGRKRDWVRWSRALVAASVKAADAARKKDLEGLLATGDEINISCEACHARYLDTPGSLVKK